MLSVVGMVAARWAVPAHLFLALAVVDLKIFSAEA
jgi:hypothetical protein